MPSAKTIVTIVGNPSGIAATASDTEIISISSISLPWNIPTPNTITQTAMTIYPSTLLNSSIAFCNGEGVSFSLPTISAIFPISVFIPVLTTSPIPLP